MKPLGRGRPGIVMAIAAGLGASGCDFTVGFHREGSEGARDGGDPPTDGSGPADGPGGADACVCPTVSDPVCGADGVTYDNDCWAACAGIEVICGGSCPCPCAGFSGGVCPPGYDCLDDLRDDCEPGVGQDCPGLCGPSDCGDGRGIPCPAGYICGDDPDDACDPIREPDCPVRCVPE